MNEQEAIALCIEQQNPKGFEFLYRTFRKEAYYHAVAMLGNPEDANDACQECFAKAYLHMIRLKELPFFYPWFYMLLKNHCLNIIRRRKRQYDLEKNETASAEILDAPDETNLKVWQTLQQLPLRYRTILMMKYIEGKNYQQISALLGIPRGTVMSRLFHARLAFKGNYGMIDQEPTGGKSHE